MWTAYQKIETIAKRDLDGSKRLIDGTFRDPAIEYLQDVKFEATEKVDGSSMCVYFDGLRVRVTGGRNENAERIEPIFTVVENAMCDSGSEQLFEQMFPPVYDENAKEVLTEVKIYGEAIGPGIQKVGKLYCDSQRFLVFDISVNGVYLERSNPVYRRVVDAFGLEEVPTLPDMTPNEAIEFVKTNPRSLVNPAAPMEGVVLRPKVRLYGPNGSRLIVKVKAKDYAPYNETADRYRWVKQGKCVVYNTMSDDGSFKTHRGNVVKIYSESGKIEGPETLVEIREIDTGMVAQTVPAYISRYDKVSWNLSKSVTGRQDDSCAEKSGDAEG